MKSIENEINNQRLRWARCLTNPIIVEKVATINAYINTTIPEEFQRFTIGDFTGEAIDGKNKVRLLKDEVVAAAKDVIIQYCWKGIEEGETYKPETWLPRSIMNRRREEGTSIIIYGNPWKKSNEGSRVKTFKKPLGRTLIAAIILKEAIYLRWLPGHLADKYEWVPYNLLCHQLMAQGKGDKNYDGQIMDYEEADWLVVDGITLSDTNSDAARIFRSNVLDKLFSARADEGLPNVLVFQDDISKCEDIQGEFGITLSGIINGRKTFKVVLSEA
jgi:hypothetical protein